MIESALKFYFSLLKNSVPARTKRSAQQVRNANQSSASSTESLLNAYESEGCR